MCEIPSNVVLAEQFAEIFDGFSIGSNDLTQLTLGVDRDSEIVAHVFDERNEAVKRLIDPHEVAEVAAVLWGPASASITGSSLSVDGGWTAR